MAAYLLTICGRYHTMAAALKHRVAEDGADFLQLEAGSLLRNIEASAAAETVPVA
jgi:hypothetical protein